MAIRHDRYNAKALVNKGNCLFMSKEYGRAKELFLEAIGVEVSNEFANPRCHHTPRGNHRGANEVAL